VTPPFSAGGELEHACRLRVLRPTATL